MNIIGLDSYKGSDIEKGFTNQQLDLKEIESKIIDNFNKGLIDEDLFCKSFEELDLLKGGKRAQVGEIREWEGKKYKKQANGKWLEISKQDLTKKEHNKKELQHREKSTKLNASGRNGFRHHDTEAFYHKRAAETLSDNEIEDVDFHGKEPADAAEVALRKVAESNLKNLDRVSSKAFSKTAYPSWSKENIRYEKEELQYSLKRIGVEGLPLSKIVKHERFEELKDSQKYALLIAHGTGNSPNAGFIKEFSSSLNDFGKIEFHDIEDKIQTGVALKQDLESDNYPRTYLGFSNPSAMKKMIPYGYKMKETLNDEEMSFVKKMIKPKYEKLINSTLTDNNIREYIKEKLSRFHDKNSNEQHLLTTNLKTQLPELYEDMKNAITSDNIDWKTFKVNSLKSIGTKHSDVVSSSFSTYYHYSAEISFMGKEYKNDNFILSSDYTSGGWN